MKPSWRQKKSAAPDGVHGSGHRLVLGQQPVREVVRAWGSATHRVLVEARDNPRLRSLAIYAQDQGIEVQTVTRSELDRLSMGSLHQGAAAWAPPLRLVDFADVVGSPELLAVALDGVVDPQNFGAVIRSAVGIAASPILWAESSSAPLSPATFRASAGAIEHAQLCRVASLHGTLLDAAAQGVEVLGLTPEAVDPLHRSLPSGPCIVVIGSEEKGMSRNVRRACTRLVRLGQSGRVQSLNASVAAGISLHCVASSRTGWGL